MPLQAEPGKKIQLGTKLKKRFLEQCFCKDICNLFGSMKVGCFNVFQSNLSTDEMIVKLNMLWSRMHKRINCQIQSTEIIAVSDWSSQYTCTKIPKEIWQPSDLTSSLSHCSYSASVLHLEIIGCLFDIQEIQFRPGKVQKPVVPCRVCGHPAQSLSE